MMNYQGEKKQKFIFDVSSNEGKGDVMRENESEQSNQLFACPVCGAQTLEHRGYWDICTECFWEDDGFVMDDENSSGLSANGPFTLGAYREWYQKAKSLYPDESGVDINARIFAALPENSPDEIMVGDLYLWTDFANS